jgi:hypothetical protein
MAPKKRASKQKLKEDRAQQEPTSSEDVEEPQGAMFYIRQFAGFVLVIIGTLVLATSYSEEYRLIPVDKNTAPYVSLGIIALGALVHEFRPWKVRSGVLSSCEVFHL